MKRKRRKMKIYRKKHHNNLLSVYDMRRLKGKTGADIASAPVLPDLLIHGEY